MLSRVFPDDVKEVSETESKVPEVKGPEITKADVSEKEKEAVSPFQALLDFLFSGLSQLNSAVPKATEASTQPQTSHEPSNLTSPQTQTSQPAQTQTLTKLSHFRLVSLRLRLSLQRLQAFQSLQSLLSSPAQPAPAFGATSMPTGPTFGSTSIPAFGTTSLPTAPAFGQTSLPSFGVSAPIVAVVLLHLLLQLLLRILDSQLLLVTTIMPITVVH